ncbi:MAG: hypothetical protein HUJ77_09890 [Clostridium sp.]|uniref:hypothetical protein n=1 Tax=Clostridium sp. TaxID=1506 RepID=UPI0025BC0812|nr:hypothetical protein [Clostridium sp.]MCF0148692.1 hypothetical protein [Clostridium sp.]
MSKRSRCCCSNNCRGCGGGFNNCGCGGFNNCGGCGFNNCGCGGFGGGFGGCGGFGGGCGFPLLWLLLLGGCW